MSNDVIKFVHQCVICQKNKPLNIKKSGLMMPLPILSKVWNDISMDFITHLPKIQGKTMVLVVIDRLSKYAHFEALLPKFNASTAAYLFIKLVVKLHGIPNSIVSDRDATFTSRFWTKLHKKVVSHYILYLFITLKVMEKTEVTNRRLKMYLRSFCYDNPQKRLKLLHWYELSYNTNYHARLGMTPFQVLYGREPPILSNYEPGSKWLE